MFRRSWIPLATAAALICALYPPVHGADSSALPKERFPIRATAKPGKSKPPTKAPVAASPVMRLYGITRGTDDFLYYNAPDGHTYSLDLASIQGGGEYTIALDVNQKPVIGYYRSSVGDGAIFWVAIDTAGVAPKGVTPMAPHSGSTSCAPTYGVYSASDAANPLKRPALYYTLSYPCQSDPIEKGGSVNLLIAT